MLKSFKTLPFLVLMCLFAFPVTATEKTIAITKTPFADSFREKLAEVVREAGISGTSHFFATRYSEDDKRFYLLWREGRAIWILDAASDTQYWEQLLLPSGGSRIDLDKDVVETREDVGSSTYLVDRPWVNSVIAEAVLEGVLITVHNP